MQRNSHCFIGYSHGPGSLPLCLPPQEEQEQWDSGLQLFPLCSWTLGQGLSTSSYLPETQLQPRIKDRVFFLSFFFPFNAMFENIFKSLLFTFLLLFFFFFSPYGCQFFWLSIISLGLIAQESSECQSQCLTFHSPACSETYDLLQTLTLWFTGREKWTLRQQSAGLKMNWNEMFHICRHC